MSSLSLVYFDLHILNLIELLNVFLDLRVGAVDFRSSKHLLIGLVGVKSHNDFVLYLC